MVNYGTPEVLFVDTFVMVNPQQRGTIIITPELVEQYQVKFRLVGKVTASGTFRVELIYPMDGFPHLIPTEMTRLARAVELAAEAQLERRISVVRPSMFQLDDIGELPRRQLRVAPGS